MSSKFSSQFYVIIIVINCKPMKCLPYSVFVSLFLCVKFLSALYELWCPVCGASGLLVKTQSLNNSMSRPSLKKSLKHL